MQDMIKLYNRQTLPIIVNRLVSLIAEYGYVVALNIILAKISLNSLLFLWIAKFVGDLVATSLNPYIKIKRPSKVFLMQLEILKGIIMALIPFLISSYFIFFVVLVFEILDDFFSSYLLATVPMIVPTSLLSRFDATLTMVSSISYFVGPLIVGLFQGFNQNVLFYMYSILIISASLFLIAMPAISVAQGEASDKNVTTPKRGKVINAFLKLLSYPVYLVLILIWAIMEGTGSTFDTYEILFLTKFVGITSAQYAFSLSFLAVVFLIVSAVLSAAKVKLSNVRMFFIGALFFLIYMFLLVFCNSFAMLLTSYSALALGSTITGNMIYTITQTEIRTADQTNIFLIQDVIIDVLSGVFVLCIAAGQSLTISLSDMYRGLFFVTLVLTVTLSIVYGMKGRRSRRGRD